MKAIKEDQAFSFDTNTFALTAEEDYLMFKPSARVLSAKSDQAFSFVTHT